MGSAAEAFPLARRVELASATLLGGPLGDLFSVSSAIDEKLARLKIMDKRLHLLPAYDAILLLCHSFYPGLWAPTKMALELRKKHGLKCHLGLHVCGDGLHFVCN